MGAGRVRAGAPRERVQHDLRRARHRAGHRAVGGAARRRLVRARERVRDRPLGPDGAAAAEDHLSLGQRSGRHRIGVTSSWDLPLIRRPRHNTCA
ncbi:hypothetical protein SGPA1_50135 [Streptomyces misionensis JCM 4497]